MELCIDEPQHPDGLSAHQLGTNSYREIIRLRKFFQNKINSQMANIQHTCGQPFPVDVML